MKEKLLPFSINENNGIITVMNELDREIKSFYKFNINSFNHKLQQSSKTTIQINILDENDHYPIFDQSINNAREQHVYINQTKHSKFNNIFIGRVYATDEDEGPNGLINYYFTNNDNYAYFHLYANGSIVLYNRKNLSLPYRLEIYARDQGNPVPLNSKESIIIHVCDVLQRTKCPSIEHQSWLYNRHTYNKQMKTNFYLGSIFIMISILLFITVIIICIVWNLIIKVQLKCKHDHIDSNNRLKSSTESYNCRVEARKNLSKELFFFFPFIVVCFFSSCFG